MTAATRVFHGRGFTVIISSARLPTARFGRNNIGYGTGDERGHARIGYSGIHLLLGVPCP